MGFQYFFCTGWVSNGFQYFFCTEIERAYHLLMKVLNAFCFDINQWNEQKKKKKKFKINCCVCHVFV